MFSQKRQKYYWNVLSKIPKNISEHFLKITKKISDKIREKYIKNF